MTDLLLRLFVRNAADTDNPATRSAIGKMSGLIDRFLENVEVVALMLVIGGVLCPSSPSPPS